jgi:glutathione synthase/RimK-type ligase-like ATP-grasp enzyme
VSQAGDLVLAVEREEIFSPGKEEADAAILRSVCEQTAKLGFRVERIPAEALKGWQEPPALILSMAQGDAALSHLSRWETKGTFVINSTESVRNCSRRDTLFSCLEFELPGYRVAPTLVLDTQGGSAGAHARNLLKDWSFPVWLKRGDFHALGPDDVFQVSDFDRLEEALSAFASRDIPKGVVQQHVEGEVVKFYGVGWDKFWCRPQENARFPMPEGVSVVGRTGWDILELEIYGGDIILSADGELFLIDLNDWPSFTGIQKEAAIAISELVQNRLRGFS